MAVLRETPLSTTLTLTIGRALYVALVDLALTNRLTVEEQIDALLCEAALPLVEEDRAATPA